MTKNGEEKAPFSTIDLLFTIYMKVIYKLSVLFTIVVAIDPITTQLRPIWTEIHGIIWHRLQGTRIPSTRCVSLTEYLEDENNYGETRGRTLLKNNCKRGVRNPVRKNVATN